jgi:Uma2 family endonuclease
MANVAHMPRAESNEPPPLQHGDALSIDEFERRWERHPEIKKAELIDGMVFLELTVSPGHAVQHSRLGTWLGVYAVNHPETQALDNVTVRIEGTTDVQPDLALRKEPGSSLVEASRILGAPELAIELAASSASYDLNTKKDVYERSGVQEYLVWQLFEGRIDWWELSSGKYVPLQADEDGAIESREFPGLRLSVRDLLAGDMASVLSVLQAAASR